MICKHAYFQYVDGKLVCSVCGTPADEVKKQVEDKIDRQAEVKRVVPKGTGKIGASKRR